MDQNWTAIIIAIIAAVGSILSAYFSRGAKAQSEKNNQELKENTKKTDETKEIVNGRMSEMLRQAEEKAFAKGVLQGRREVEIELHGRDGTQGRSSST